MTVPPPASTPESNGWSFLYRLPQHPDHGFGIFADTPESPLNRLRDMNLKEDVRFIVDHPVAKRSGEAGMPGQNRDGLMLAETELASQTYNTSTE